MREKGVTLIELLISLLIFSLLMLGIETVQLVSLRQAKAAFYVAIAAQQLDAMAEQWRHGQVTPAALQQWNQQNAQLLPQGRGELSASSSLIIHWGDPALACHPPQVDVSGCLSRRLVYA